MPMIPKCTPASVNFLTQLTQCVDVVAGWTSSNRLQLNSDKTKVLWCSTSRHQGQLPSTPLSVNEIPVDQVRCVRDLGINIDCDQVMCSGVQKTTSACFATSRQLRQTRHSVPSSTLQTLLSHYTGSVSRNALSIKLRSWFIRTGSTLP